MPDARLITDGEAGSSVRAKLNFDRAAIFNAQEYGWLPDGSDDSVAALALLDIVYAAGGGTIYFPPSTGKYRADSQLLIPNDGDTVPNQPNIRLTGGGGGSIWGNLTRTSLGAAVLDLRYTAVDGNAKIEARGCGGLKIDNLTIIDGGSDNATPFIHTTNTTLTIRDCTFIGTGHAGQDGIVCGGESNQTHGGGVTAPFAGYGTVIDSNHFRGIGRSVFGRTYANSLIVTGNSILDPVGTCAMEFAASSGNPPDIITGLHVVGNIIEVTDPLVYGIVLRGVMQSFFANDFYDGQGDYVSDYRLVDPTNGITAYNVFIRKLSGGVMFTQTGETIQLGLQAVLGSTSSDNAYGDGKASSLFPYGAEVTGTWNTAYHAAGPLTVRDMFSQTELLTMGAGIIGTYEANIDSWSNVGANRPLNLNPRGGPVTTGLFAIRPSAKTLVNGLNSNIALYAVDDTAKTSYMRLSGPTGAFSVGGFSSLIGGATSRPGTILHIFNSTAQTMTIVNESASSTEANRIKTLTAADVVLRATAPSAATFIYDGTEARWILLSTN